MYQPTERVRTRNTFVPYTASEVITLCNGSKSENLNIRPDRGFDFVGNGMDEITQDMDGAGFHASSKSGSIHVNPFYSRKRVFWAVSKGAGTWSRKTGTGCAACTGSLVNTGTRTGTTGASSSSYSAPNAWPSDENLKIDAGTQAMAGVAGPKLAGLVTLAEMGETYRFLRNPFQMLARLNRRANTWRRDRGGNMETVEDLADYMDAAVGGRLAYRYAVLPIINDVNSAIAAFAQDYSDRRERFTSRGRVEVIRPQQAVLTNLPASSGGGWALQNHRKWDRTVEVRAGVLYEHHLTLNSNLGFSVDQIPIASWEAITLSFVADWLWNVGDYIQAITPKVGVNILGSWTTLSEYERFHWLSVHSAFNTSGCGSGLSAHTYSGTPGFECSIDTTTRTRSSGVDVGLVPKFEQFDLGKTRDQNRLVDAIALALAAIGPSRVRRASKGAFRWLKANFNGPLTD